MYITYLVPSAINTCDNMKAMSICGYLKPKNGLPEHWLSTCPQAITLANSDVTKAMTRNIDNTRSESCYTSPTTTLHLLYFLVYIESSMLCQTPPHFHDLV